MTLEMKMFRLPGSGHWIQKSRQKCSKDRAWKPLKSPVSWIGGGGGGNGHHLLQLKFMLGWEWGWNSLIPPPLMGCREGYTVPVLYFAVLKCFSSPLPGSCASGRQTSKTWCTLGIKGPRELSDCQACLCGDYNSQPESCRMKHAFGERKGGQEQMNRKVLNASVRVGGQQPSFYPLFNPSRIGCLLQLAPQRLKNSGTNCRISTVMCGVLQG